MGAHLDTTGTPDLSGSGRWGSSRCRINPAFQSYEPFPVCGGVKMRPENGPAGLPSSIRSRSVKLRRVRDVTQILERVDAPDHSAFFVLPFLEISA